MLHVAWPWMLAFLPLPWLVARFVPAAAPGGATVFLPFAAMLGESAGITPRVWPLRRLLMAVVWVLLIAAAVRPQWLGEAQASPTTGRRLLLAVDVSRSMSAQDMAGQYSRLQVVQALGGEFIEGRRGDQVGLILFGSQPYLQAPLTFDLDTTASFLHQALIGMAGNQTAIGDAIGLALKRLRDDAAPEATDGGGHADTVLILLTDGSNTAGVMPPLEAAKMAQANGLRIYTIGVGAAAQPGFFGGPGNTDLDEDTLRGIAEATGGAYFRATDAQALQDIYAKIDALEPSAGRDQWYRPTTEWYLWPLALALLLSLPAVALRGRT